MELRGTKQDDKLIFEFRLRGVGTANDSSGGACQLNIKSSDPNWEGGNVSNDPKTLRYNFLVVTKDAWV